MQQEFSSLEAPPAALSQAAVDPAQTMRVDDIVLSVHTDLASIERIWRDFERRVPISVYQRFDWVAPWCRHAAPLLAIEAAVVLGTRRGRPVLLLPFGRHQSRFGAEITWLGCSHVNVGMGLFEPGLAASLDAPRVRELFARVFQEMGPVDYLALHNQPIEWNGIANPLRHLAGRSDDQPVLAITLAPDFPSMLNARKRKKLRWQENTLAKCGGYRFFRAEDCVEANAIFDQFLVQKEDQFAKLGIDNVFATGGSAEFFRTMITQSAGKSDPVIQLYGLEIDGKIRATFAGGVHDRRLFGFFSGISTDDYQRVSPGELLLHHLVRDSCERGYKTLDLGVGEERYKAAWSPVRQRQFATYLPVTLRGRLVVAFHGTAHRIKLSIRQNDRAWTFAKRLRELRAKMFPRRGSPA